MQFLRTEKTLKEGVEQIRKPQEGMSDMHVKDKSLLFNTDLVETLEFDNLVVKLFTKNGFRHATGKEVEELYNRRFQKER